LVIGLGVIFAVDLCVVVVRNVVNQSRRNQMTAESDDAKAAAGTSDPRTEGRLRNFARAEGNSGAAT